MGNGTVHSRVPWLALSVGLPLVAGLLIGILAASQLDGIGISRPDPATALAAPDSSTDSHGSAAGARGAEPALMAPSVEEPAPAGHAAGSAELATTATPETIAQLLPSFTPARGEGVIAGRVTQFGTDAPVAGVLIELFDWYKWAFWVPARMAFPEDELTGNGTAAARQRSLLGEHSGSLAGYWHTRSDIAGHFEFRDLPGKYFVIRARSPRGAFQAHEDDGRIRDALGVGDQEFFEANAGDFVQFRGGDSVQVKFVATAPDGSPISDRIVVSGSLLPDWAAREDPAGLAAVLPKTWEDGWHDPAKLVRLAPGWWLFRATLTGDDSHVASQAAIWELRPGSGTVIIPLPFRPVGGLTILVKDQTGYLADKDLGVCCTLQVHLNQGQFPSDSDFATETAVQLKHGVAVGTSFLNLDSGEDYALSLTWQSTDIWQQRVHYDGTPIQIEVTLPAPGPTNSAVVWVRDPEGKPLPSAGLAARFHDADGGQREAAFRRRADGAWELFALRRFLPPDGSPLRWTVTVIHPQYGLLSGEIDGSKTNELTLQYAAPATVTVVLEGDVSSEALGQLRVRITGMGNQEAPQGVRRVTLPPVQPGEVVVSVTVMLAGQQIGFVCHRHQCNVTAGEQEVRVALPPFYPLTVLVEDGLTGSFFDLTISEFRDLEFPLARSTFFPGLPAGQYIVSTYHERRRATVEFTLPGVSTVTLAPPPPEPEDRRGE